jgi:hypothetical protein
MNIIVIRTPQAVHVSSDRESQILPLTKPFLFNIKSLYTIPLSLAIDFSARKIIKPATSSSLSIIQN